MLGSLTPERRPRDEHDKGATRPHGVGGARRRLHALPAVRAGDTDRVRGAQAQCGPGSFSSASSPAIMKTCGASPFVGPAGRVLDEALEEAKINRSLVLRDERRQTFQVDAARR